MIKPISQHDLELIITSLLHEEIVATAYGGPVSNARARSIASLRERLLNNDPTHLRVVA